MTSSWMWPADDGDTHGATIDGERILWFDSGIGCACGDSNNVQTLDAFLQRGAPIPVPDDVLEEIKATVSSTHRPA
jgi:hypothetical protein